MSNINEKDVKELAHNEENFSDIDISVEESLKDYDSPSIIEDIMQLIQNDSLNESDLNTENISSDFENIQGATIDDILD
ncbi:22892_t:CDS:2, partial [Racocetra persica]